MGLSVLSGKDNNNENNYDNNSNNYDNDNNVCLLMFLFSIRVTCKMSFRKTFLVWCVLRRVQAVKEASVSSASVSQYCCAL